MGNSLPVEDQGAQAAPEQDPGAQSLTEQGRGAQSLAEQDRGAQSLAEQDRGAQSLAEQDRGAQSLAEQDQSAQRAPEPESGDMSGAEPEAGATSGQEVSSPEGSGGYAAHAASPYPSECAVAWFRTLPSSGGFPCSRGFGPACCYSGRRCRCLGTLASTGFDCGRWPSRASWWCCLFGGSGYQAPAARHPKWEPGAARCRTGAERGGGGFTATGVLEGTRSPPTGGRGIGTAPPSGGKRTFADALPFLRSTDFDRIDVRFISGGGSQDVLGGATGITGKGRLDRPEEFAEETPYMPPRLPRFPEDEQQRAPQKLLIDQATITDNALSEWHAWLKLAQQGRSLREWGVISSDIVTAVQYLGEAPPQEEPATRGGRWHSGRGGWRKQQQQEYPTSVGVLLYLKKALKCIDCFDRAPSGYRGLLLGPSSAMALERPDGGTASDEREAWKYIVASMTAIYLQTPKAAAAKPRPVAPATPTTPAEDNSSDSSSEASEVSGESQLEGEGVAEAIGVIRSCQDKGGVPLDPRGRFSAIWNTRVPAQGFSGSRGYGSKVCGDGPGHRYRSFGSSRVFGRNGWNSSGYSGDGAANSGGNRAEKPGKPGISYLPARPAGGEDAHGVGRFHGTLASWSTTSTCFTTTSTAALEKLSCAALAKSSCTSPRADATGKGVYPPRAFGRSIFRAFGRHRFRNRSPIRRLRKRSGGSPSCYRKRKSGSVNSFDLCVLKEKKTFGEHVLHVWHEGFEWHGLGMKLGMNVSLICACFGSLGNPEAPQSLQALTFLPSLLSLPSSRVRTPAMFVDVVAATLFAGLLFAWSLLSGIAFWWCSLVFQFFRKWFRRRGLRTKRFRAKCRRKPSCFRMKLRNRWVRLETQRQLVVVRKEKYTLPAQTFDKGMLPYSKQWKNFL